MLATNWNNFEIFGSPYCLLSIDLHLLTAPPPIYAYLAKILSPFLLSIGLLIRPVETFSPTEKIKEIYSYPV